MTTTRTEDQGLDIPSPGTINGAAVEPAEPLPPPVAAIPADTNAAGPPPERSAAKPFPVVGIGASVGGLAAFEAFFSAIPRDIETGMAFVLVQHLAPDHKSILTELVKRYTRMQVQEVEDGMRVEPDCAYIIPPNNDMALFNGALRSSRRRRAGCACRSTSSSAPWHKTSMSEPSVSSSRVPAATAPWARGRSRAKAGW